MSRSSTKDGSKLHETKMRILEQADMGTRLSTDAKGLPARYFDSQPSKANEKLQAKAALAKASGGHFMIGDSDIQDQLNTDRAAEQYDLENTFTQLFGNTGLQSPAELAKLQQLFPEYYDRREETIERWGRLQTQMAKIRLRGFKDKDDFILWMMHKRGQVKIPKEAIWAVDADYDAEVQFRRGKWNPFNQIVKPGSDSAELKFSVDDLTDAFTSMKMDGPATFRTKTIDPQNAAQRNGKWAASVYNKLGF